MTSQEIDHNPAGYADLLADLKARVRATQFEAPPAADVPDER